MSQSRRLGKRPMTQPPPEATPEEHIPPTSRVRQELHDTDLERTISTEPSSNGTSMTGGASTGGGPNNRTFILPISNTSFDPFTVHRKILPCVTKIFPKAIKSFNDDSKYLKDMWFNEFKKLYQWEPEDEQRVRETFEKKKLREGLVTS